MQHKPTNSDDTNMNELESFASDFIGKLRNVRLSKTEAQDMRDRLLA